MRSFPPPRVVVSPRDVLRAILEARGWTQVRLAAELGVDVTSVWAWIGRRQLIPHEAFVADIARLSQGRWSEEELMRVWYKARKERPVRGPAPNERM